MITFKSKDFCFTLNKSAIAHIVSGVDCIKESEKSAIKDAKHGYYDTLRKMKEDKDFSGFTEMAQVAMEDARKRYMQLSLNCTIMSIFTIGGCINISVRALLHIVKNLEDEGSDFYTYIAVSDFVDYIDYKLNNLDIGYVDFEDKDILAEFKDFCQDKVDSRRNLITKSVVSREQTTVKLSDYLIYYVSNDGNYIINNEGDINGKES